MKPLTVSWFSAGVSSAVATKLAIDQIDKIIYTHIDDQHPDTLRFVNDCEKWFNKPVEILQSPYRTVAAAWLASGWKMPHTPGGHAPCTNYLKRRVRKEWECEHENYALTYVWGMDCNEGDRADRLLNAMPNQQHRFPLMEQNIPKAEAHRILHASGIKRPAMYDMGYQNNNCIGCVRGGQAYFNRIRKDFPEVFAARAQMERIIGGTCINGIWLDELDPEAGRDKPPIVEDCGIFCELMRLT